MAQYIVGLIVKYRGFEESKISPEILNNKDKIKNIIPDNLFWFACGEQSGFFKNVIVL